MNYKETKSLTSVKVDINKISNEELQELFKKFDVKGANKGEFYNGVYYIPKSNVELVKYLKDNNMLIDNEE